MKKLFFILALSSMVYVSHGKIPLRDKAKLKLKAAALQVRDYFGLFKPEPTHSSPQSFVIPKTKRDIVLVLEKGDITQSPAQAIVNAANEQLSGGAGVCGAIFNAAGWKQLQNGCNRLSEKNGVRCPTGHAKTTGSFNLRERGIEYIIHAVGPDCRIVTHHKDQDHLLKQAYISALEEADKHNVKSIAFPFISSAIYAFPKKRAARIALEAVAHYTQTHDTKLEKVYFVLHSQEDFNLFCNCPVSFTWKLRKPLCTMPKGD